MPGTAHARLFLVFVWIICCGELCAKIGFYIFVTKFFHSEGDTPVLFLKSLEK